MNNDRIMRRPDNQSGTDYRFKSTPLLYKPNDGKLHKRDNPFFNGKINFYEEVNDFKTGKTVKRHYLSMFIMVIRFLISH